MRHPARKKRILGRPGYRAKSCAWLGLLLLGWLAANPALAERKEPAPAPTAPSVTPAPGIPADETGFTAYMARALADALPDAEISIAGPLTLTLRLPSGGEIQANLDRTFKICSSSADDCALAVEQYVSAGVETVAQLDAKPDRQMLRVAIRRTDYAEGALSTIARNGGKEIVTERLEGGLSLVLVFDYSKIVRTTTTLDLEVLGLSREEAIGMAKQRVASSLRPLAETVEELPPGRFGIIDGDPYESSRLLLHDDWAWLAERLNGSLIVAVPAQDLVLYGRANDPRAVAEMADLAQSIVSGDAWALTTAMFRWSPSGWELVLL